MSFLVPFHRILVVSIVTGLVTLLLGETVADDLLLPGARIVAAESRGFEVLATAGGECSPRYAQAGGSAPHAVGVLVDASAAVPADAKAKP